MRSKITNLLKQLGIPANIKGYYYLRSAVEIASEDMSLIYQITKRLYPSIADMYDTTWTRVERAIRHAIEVSWNRGDLALQKEIFGYTIDQNKGKPTNSEFIAMISDYIAEDIR